MALHHYPKIVTDSLIMYLDANNSTSYPSGSSIWYDISKNSYDHTLYNGVSFTTVDGVNCFDCTTTGNIRDAGAFTYGNATTLMAWARALSDGDVGTWRTLWRDSGYHPLLIENSTDLVGFYLGGFFSFGTTLSALGGDNTWSLYTVTMGTASSSFYFNGEYVGSVAKTSSTRSYDFFGNYTTSQPFGYVASNMAYNRILSDAEIKHNYITMRGRFGL